MQPLVSTMAIVVLTGSFAISPKFRTTTTPTWVYNKIPYSQSARIADIDFRSIPRYGVTYQGWATCPSFDKPLPRVTPLPPNTLSDKKWEVIADFTVDTNGDVVDPVVVRSIGSNNFQEDLILETLKTWHYSSATCFDIVTEAEGTIAFSN